MTLRIVPVGHTSAVLRALDRRIFRSDAEPEWAGRSWWVVRIGERAVAFCGMRIDGATAYLSRAGVHPRHRGVGLHSMMISARVCAARVAGCREVLTYTMSHNAPSANNLAKAGFRVFRPDAPWFESDSDVIYWRLAL